MVIDTLWEGMCELRWVSGLGNDNLSFWFQLAADPDQNVRSGSELLDRLLKVGANRPYVRIYLKSCFQEIP